MTIPAIQAPRRTARLNSLDTSIVGSWQLIGHGLRTGKAVDLTSFRGVPTQAGQFGFSDPFGAKQLNLAFPEVKIWDTIGQGDLSWAAKGASIELIWVGPVPSSYPFGIPVWGTFSVEGDVFRSPFIMGWIGGFRWEGYVGSVDIDTDEGLTTSCVGALYQLDKYEAKPEFPTRPYPYEFAIERQFKGKPHLRVKHLKTAWPQDWSKFYQGPGADTSTYLVPAGVRAGAPWTGLLTRSTGSWEAVLTSYIQTLLTGMYTANGRWTIDMVQGRQPLLLHRPIITEPTSATALVDLSAPGNKASLSEDWSQSLDVVYGQGTALDGVAYSGMEVSSDGARTFYEPLAYRRQAFPTTNNKWLDTREMPTEVMLQLQQGLDPSGAQQVAQFHLRSFADPGWTGTITLGVDPTMNGEPLLRYLVRAGMDIATPGFQGRPEPTLFHVTDNTVDLVAETNTLTVDTKFRDALTLKEVRARGRDALKVTRKLVGGQYTPPIPDQLVPWNYNKGSGFIPSGHVNNAVELFNGIPDQVIFPWTPWTKKRPPKDHKWRNAYIHIGPADHTLPRNNWAYRQGGPSAQHGKGGHFGIPIRAAQAATIRLLQVAAYDRNGNVLAVPFHISFYTSRFVNVGSMPIIEPNDVTIGGNDGYASPGHYPFAPSAWETYEPSGVLANPQIPVATQGSGLIRVYGTGFEQAGMYPNTGTTLSGGGRAPTGTTAATGLLVDESQWSIDTTQEGQNYFDPYTKKQNAHSHTGMIWAMIYCDAQADNDVYFLGRMFRVEPGTGS